MKDHARIYSLFSSSLVHLVAIPDAEGKVTKAEIAKNDGMGFDEEALNAVRQFRFEPARRDGANVPSELTYIYRFRLEK
jgi:periplasmic protein TonB